MTGPHAWGPAEIRGNAIRDLAALRKLEMLPWDEWGRMTASYQGKTGPDYDALMDAGDRSPGYSGARQPHEAADPSRYQAPPRRRSDPSPTLTCRLAC